MRTANQAASRRVPEANSGAWRFTDRLPHCSYQCVHSATLTESYSGAKALRVKCITEMAAKDTYYSIFGIGLLYVESVTDGYTITLSTQ